jgi:hypothetical protein
MHLLLRLIFFPFLYILLASMQPWPRGVSYKHIKTEGPLSIHLLELDPDYVTVKAVHAREEVLSLEKTSSIAKRHKAFAAVNGGFFRMYGPYAGSSSGVLRISNEWLSSPRKNRGALGWKDGGKSVLIDRVGLNAELLCNDALFPIDGINQPRLLSQAILYTSKMGGSTQTDSPGLEIAINEEGIVSYFKNTGDTEIPSKGWIYSIAPTALIDFPENYIGSTIALSFSPFALNEPENSGLWDEMEYIVGGTPVLISKGLIVPDFNSEQVLTSFLEKKHARTAVGIKPNGNWIFVVVDSFQPLYSAGMTMDELAQFMHSLGCLYALNLDGGGSSTLYLNGKVKNSPSGDDDDGPYPIRGERKVSDAILIFLKNNQD